jgi:hypothetical protein
MKALGKELEFISFIKRDGSGTIAVGTEWNEDKTYPKIDDVSYLDDDSFNLNTLSLSNRTFIASGFNTWVVKIKNDPLDKIKTFKSE